VPVSHRMQQLLAAERERDQLLVRVTLQDQRLQFVERELHDVAEIALQLRQIWTDRQLGFTQK